MSISIHQGAGGPEGVVCLCVLETGTDGACDVLLDTSVCQHVRQIDPAVETLRSWGDAPENSYGLYLHHEADRLLVLAVVGHMDPIWSVHHRQEKPIVRDLVQDLLVVADY